MPSAGTLSCWCDESSGSDGEAFPEGFKRLKLGKVIGTRTWGGEIWLSFDNMQADNGIAPPPSWASTARKASGSSKATASTRTSSSTIFPRPHTTERTRNWRRRLRSSSRRFKADPRPVPPHPPYPDKSFKYAQ